MHSYKEVKQKYDFINHLFLYRQAVSLHMTLQFTLPLLTFHSIINFKIENSIKMENVAQMNKRLIELNQNFIDYSSQFIHQINLHQTKFTFQDMNDFEALLKKIKVQVNSQINEFFNQKISQRSSNYEEKISTFEEKSSQTHDQLMQFRTQLERETLNLKDQQKRSEATMQHLSKKFAQNQMYKTYLDAFKKNCLINKKERQTNNKADELYRKNLQKKAFFPWRTLTYKDGYGNTVIAQTQNDIQNIHQQYSSIINMLKQKIQQTDSLIKVKKAAKAEFAYSLNKNLMKTISNLSLQVMSLNQMSLRDDQFESEESLNIMGDIGNIVAYKMKEVETFKKSLLGETDCETRKKTIRFA